MSINNVNQMTQTAQAASVCADAAALALKAKEVFSRNLDTLIAGFLIRHPEIDPSLVRVNMQTTPDGIRAFVTPVKIPLPGSRMVDGEPTIGDAGSRAFAFGWNACLREVVRGINDMQQPPMEDTDGQ